ncbi:hypothetical protein [Bacteroides sp.]|uniref:hypothetical protein n=1 Tax=Bacteroides sp. TaxID=29523 RepID=UPI003A905EAD
MLIRSQDKEILVNMETSIVFHISGVIGKKYPIFVYWKGNGYVIGFYSTKVKAMKVLDMIQEAYADAELIPMTVPNIGKMFAKATASKENELLAEAMGKALMNKMVFQMPEDSEVEV